MANKKSATTEYKTIEDWLKRHPQKVRMQRVFDKLRRLFQQEDKQDLDWWYSVGCQALILYPIDDQRFGQNFIQKLAKGLPISKDRSNAKKQPTSYEQDRANTLLRARKLANKFSRDKLRNLHRNLTVNHIMGLLTVDEEKNHKSLDEFAKDCVAKGWSARELSREIQNDRGVKRSAGGRRPKPKTAATAAIAVRDLILSARRWLTCKSAATNSISRFPRR